MEVEKYSIDPDKKIEAIEKQIEDLKKDPNWKSNQDIQKTLSNLQERKEALSQELEPAA